MFQCYRTWPLVSCMAIVAIYGRLMFSQRSVDRLAVECIGPLEHVDSYLVFLFSSFLFVPSMEFLLFVESPVLWPPNAIVFFFFMFSSLFAERFFWTSPPQIQFINAPLSTIIHYTWKHLIPIYQNDSFICLTHLRFEAECRPPNTIKYLLNMRWFYFILTDRKHFDFIHT